MTQISAASHWGTGAFALARPRGVPDCLAGDVYGLLGVQALRRCWPQENDGAISFQVGLIDAIAVNGLADPVAADDRYDDAHDEAGVLQTHTADVR